MAEPRMLWAPSRDFREASNLARYVRWLADERGMGFTLDDYQSLWAWSVDEPDAFWQSIWDFFDVQADGGDGRALADATMPGAVWFPTARLNYAEHVFRDVDPDAVAIVEAGELRATREITWAQLREQTARIAGGLRTLGVGPGDRVVAFMPNISETIAAFFAVASIGAVWSSCSPDFGTRSVVDRFAQIEPKVLLAVDGYRYGGRDFDKVEEIAGLQARMPTLEHTVVLPYLAQAPGIEGLERAITWEDLLERGSGFDLTFERVAFSDPLWILYSSGTTGLPKAIIQSQGGILLEHLKMHWLHLDAHAGDRIFWFTTTGWMMWNFLTSVLLTDSEIVLYDGNPGFPTMDRLWDLAAETGMTCFGTSASYLAACMKAGVEPRGGRDLPKLRSVGSTGSPLSREGFRWVYGHLGEETWLFSTSGGTDVCSAFVGGCPLVPVYEGEIQARALGAKVEAFDDAGHSLVGEVGELVITAPMPSMPVGLWNDPDGSRYRESYFAMYPGIWRHGDWIEITTRGTAIIYGRSDSTINRGGIRMGTAEIYRSVLTIDDITDALVVDVPDPDPSKDAWMVLFVVLADGAVLDDDLRGQLARRIREDCSPRHVPNDVFAVAEIPRTMSGKVLEVPVKRILMGHPVGQVVSRDSLANPASLDWFVELAATRS